ncbi:MAG: DUF3943 domain-containing protein [Desulfuromonadaceae bacterium]|nr:DUF3943 domain-containing protein [Desulfuromonadaceae bacterium]
MYLNAVNPVIRRPGPVVRLACAALLLLALHTESSARTLSPSDHDKLTPHATVTDFSGIAEENADSAEGGEGDKNAEISNAAFADKSSAPADAAAASADETESYESLSYQSVVENRVPDWNGLWRDTGILFGSQVVAAAVTLMLPESVSGWSSEEKKNSFSKYGDNFIHPVIDNDKFYINYILHPYWGATYYTRARERGFDKGSSFLYSTLISTLYEFGPECFYEKPSIQDLIVTPVAGSLLGAFIFEPWREYIKRKQELRWYDHVSLVATDPVGVLSLAIEKMFGLKPTIMIDYAVPKLHKADAGSPLESRSSRIGVVMQFPLD